jgi:hypothetical protein
MKTVAHPSKKKANRHLKPKKNSPKMTPYEHNAAISILKMPPEIFTMILELLDQRDLLAVRLSSKSLAVTATLPLARTIKKSQRFEFTKKDIDRLVGLTAIPEFASSLKSLLFSTRFSPGHESAIIAWHFRSLSETFPDSRAGQELMAMYRADAPGADIQGSMLSRGDHLMQLTRAMRSLQACGNLEVILGVYDDEVDQDQQVLQAVRLRVGQNLGNFVPVRLPQVDDFLATFSVLVNAVELSDFPMKTMELNLEHDDLSKNSMQKMDEQAMPWDTVQSLPTLRIKMRLADNPLATTEISSDRLGIKMRHCKMSSWNPSEDYTYFRCKKYWDLCDRIYVKACYSKISLEEVNADYDSLHRFLFPSQSNRALKELTLREMTLWQLSDTCMDFFRKLKETVTLESLVMSGIEDPEHDFVQQDEVHWKGREEIHAGLDLLIVKMSTWSWD